MSMDCEERYAPVGNVRTLSRYVRFLDLLESVPCADLFLLVQFVQDTYDGLV